jgi:hypothetical protein
MRIFLVEFEVSVGNIVNPAGHYKLSKLSDINHAALTLDQTIFGGRQEIDWVLFTQRNEIKFDTFCTFEKYIPTDSKIIFSTTGNSLECFYCRPGIFPIIGSKYKTKDDTFYMLAKQKIDIQHI